MRILANILRTFKVSSRESCKITNRRYSSQICPRIHGSCTSVESPASVISVRSFTTSPVGCKNSGTAGTFNSSTGSNTSSNQIIPVALLKTDGESDSSHLKVLVIPINLFSNDEESVQKTMSTMSIIRDNADQIDIFTNNASAFTKKPSNPKESESVTKPKRRVEEPLWQNLDNEPENVFSDGLNEPLAEHEINPRKSCNAFDAEDWNDSKTYIIADIPPNLEKRLGDAGITSMDLAFEMDMTNIKDALTMRDKMADEFGDPISKNLRDPMITMSTSVESENFKGDSTVPLSFNALIQGTVNIDSSKLTPKRVEEMKVPQFNDYVTTMAANICSTALQKGFPTDLSRMYSTKTTDTPKRPKSPHIVCERQGDKGCVSPGNADLDPFIPKGKKAAATSKKEPKEMQRSCRGSESLLTSAILGETSARGLMSCKVYAIALKEASRLREQFAAAKKNKSCAAATEHKLDGKKGVCIKTPVCPESKCVKIPCGPPKQDSICKDKDLKKPPKNPPTNDPCQQQDPPCKKADSKSSEAPVLKCDSKAEQPKLAKDDDSPCKKAPFKCPPTKKKEKEENPDANNPCKQNYPKQCPAKTSVGSCKRPAPDPCAPQGDCKKKEDKKPQPSCPKPDPCGSKKAAAPEGSKRERSPHVVCERQGGKGCVSPGNAELDPFVPKSAAGAASKDGTAKAGPTKETPRPRSPHVVCLREGDKGCVSPGNADLPNFVSKGATKDVASKAANPCATMCKPKDSPFSACDAFRQACGKKTAPKNCEPPQKCESQPPKCNASQAEVVKFPEAKCGSTAPKCVAGKKAEPPKCGAQKKAEPPKCGPEKKAEPPKCGAEKKAEPPKCGAEKKAEPPKCGAEKKAEPPKCGAEKKAEPPKCGAQKKAEPPKCGAQKKAEPPKCGAQKKAGPPKCGAEPPKFGAKEAESQKCGAGKKTEPPKCGADKAEPPKCGADKAKPPKCGAEVPKCGGESGPGKCTSEKANPCSETRKFGTETAIQAFSPAALCSQVLKLAPPNCPAREVKGPETTKITTIESGKIPFPATGSQNAKTEVVNLPNAQFDSQKMKENLMYRPKSTPSSSSLAQKLVPPNCAQLAVKESESIKRTPSESVKTTRPAASGHLKSSASGPIQTVSSKYSFVPNLEKPNCNQHGTKKVQTPKSATPNQLKSVASNCSLASKLALPNCPKPNLAPSQKTASKENITVAAAPKSDLHTANALTKSISVTDLLPKEAACRPKIDVNKLSAVTVDLCQTHAARLAKQGKCKSEKKRSSSCGSKKKSSGCSKKASCSSKKKPKNKDDDDSVPQCPNSTAVKPKDTKPNCPKGSGNTGGAAARCFSTYTSHKLFAPDFDLRTALPLSHLQFKFGNFALGCVDFYSKNSKEGKNAVDCPPFPPKPKKRTDIKHAKGLKDCFHQDRLDDPCHKPPPKDPKVSSCNRKPEEKGCWKEDENKQWQRSPTLLLIPGRPCIFNMNTTPFRAFSTAPSSALRQNEKHKIIERYEENNAEQPMTSRQRMPKPKKPLKNPNIVQNEIIRIGKAGEIIKAIENIDSVMDYDVLVRVGAIALSGSDIHVYETGGDRCIGMTIGHDASGIVERVGKCVDKLKPGDCVALESGLCCGICDVCKQGDYNLCPQLFHNGFFSTHQTHPADLCHKIPDSISLEDATLTPTLALGCQACFKARVTPTTNVLIIGTCPKSCAAALCARALGAKSVAVMASNVYTLESIRILFDFDYIHYYENETNLIEKLTERTCSVLKDRPNVIINFAISESTMNMAINLLKPGGKCVLAECDQEHASFNAMDVLMKSISLITSFRSANMFPTALNLMKSGKTPIGELVSRIYTWDQLTWAFHWAQYEANMGNRKVIVQGPDLI